MGVGSSNWDTQSEATFLVGKIMMRRSSRIDTGGINEKHVLRCQSDDVKNSLQEETNLNKHAVTSEREVSLVIDRIT
jgi:hypothetical protein